MQLDYISKMSKGKRIPKEEERLTCLLDAMECTGNTRADLLFLYRQEKMGKSHGAFMEELIRIIPQDVVGFPQVSVSTSVSGIPDTDMPPFFLCRAPFLSLRMGQYGEHQDA